MHALSAMISGQQPAAVDFSNAANLFAGSGAALTNLSASNLASGTIDPLRMPTGGAWSLASPLTL